MSAARRPPSQTRRSPPRRGTPTVDAVDAAANHSAPSQPASATTPAPPDTTAPSTPGSVTATPVDPNRIDVAWSPSTDNVAVTGYTIRRDGAAIVTVPASATSYSDM